MFKAYNDDNKKLVSHVKGCQDIISGGQRWFSELKNSIHKSFNKIRIGSPNKDKILQNLLDQKFFMKREIRNIMKLKIDLNVDELQDKLKAIEENISNHSVKCHTNKISKYVEEIRNESKKLDNSKMWKMQTKLCPKSLELPSAKLNEKGILVSEKSELKQLYKNTYINRLSHRAMLPQYETIFNLKNYLFDLRMAVTSRIKSPDWTMAELMKVLKNLKNNKSADHFGMIYELFKPGLIGQDLIYSLLILCNEIKNQ